jgi:hypothetical protein
MCDVGMTGQASSRGMCVWPNMYQSPWYELALTLEKARRFAKIPAARRGSLTLICRK